MTKPDFVAHFLDDGVPGRGRIGRFYVCRLQVGGNKNAALLWQLVSNRFWPLKDLEPGQAPKVGSFVLRAGAWWLHNPREEWARLAGLTEDEYDSAIRILKAQPWLLKRQWLFKGKTRVWLSVDWVKVPKADSSEYEQFEDLRQRGFRIIGGANSGLKEPVVKKSVLGK